MLQSVECLSGVRCRGRADEQRSAIVVGACFQRSSRTVRHVVAFTCFPQDVRFLYLCQ